MRDHLPYYPSIIKVGGDGIVDETGYDVDDYTYLFVDLKTPYVKEERKKRKAIDKKTRLMILDRDNKTCCLCYEHKEFLEIDHIDNDPSNSQLNNLQVLCRKCHMKKTKLFHFNSSSYRTTTTERTITRIDDF